MAAGVTSFQPLVMSGHDRTYMAPRSVRRALAEAGDPNSELVRTGRVTAWDLFRLVDCPQASEWAGNTLDALVASLDSEGSEALGCTDCQDVGFYGVADDFDPDLLTGLVRRTGDSEYERLTADGSWTETTCDGPVEVLDLDTAADLAVALTAGAPGLLRRFYVPKAWLAPTQVLAASPLADVLSSDAPGDPQSEWVNYAVVDDVDPGAVIDVVRIRRDGDTDLAEVFDGASWVPDESVLASADLPMVQLTVDQLSGIQEAMSQSAIVADAPLTVSPDPRAEKLRRYWSTGKGALKIRWMTPGDWKRCYKHLFKYMGVRAKGYCANLHKRNDHVWPGDRRNPGGNGRRGRLLSSADSPEFQLSASIHSGQWAWDTERNEAMAEPSSIPDGVYSETDESFNGILTTLTAGGFPVAPPEEWFANPNLSGPTPLTVTDEGRVFGHIATFDVTHIGMAGKTKPPRSASEYSFYKTGVIKAAGGKDIPVGQITLSGGHAPMHATAAQAVQHYDSTNSAAADVNCGEDPYGIWVAGGVRPGITPEQVRALRASAPSGDWRDINGHLELVAVCQVNVPGFPVARAMAASGAVLSLVAAGARPLAELKASEHTSTALLTRMDRLEQALEALVAAQAPAELVVETGEEDKHADPEPEKDDEDESEDPPVGDEPTAEAEEKPDPRLELRKVLQSAQRAALRDSVAAAGKVPPQFLKNIKKKKADAEDAKDGGKDEDVEDAKGRKKKPVAAAGPLPTKRTIPGTDSFPIKTVGDLKNAIQAFGRAKDKEAAKRHIIRQAMALGHPELIPDGWKQKSNA